MRDRYYNDEEYRNNQIQKAKLHYELNKEKILEKLKEKAIENNEDFKKKRVINNHKYYLKKKAEREAKKEAEKKAKELEKKAKEEVEKEYKEEEEKFNKPYIGHFCGLWQFLNDKDNYFKEKAKELEERKKVIEEAEQVHIIANS
jgi:hypothetical protein